MLSQGNIIIIGLVILVLFGAAAIPKFARSIGQAKKEFTKAMKEGEEEEEETKALENKGKKKA